MKQLPESSDPCLTFPSVLSKIQSGSLFTKSNMQSVLVKSKSSISSDLTKSLESPKLFCSYLLTFYKGLGLDSDKSQAASSKIEYLQSLYLRVADKGGWAQVTGRDYWSHLELSELFRGEKTREDYETFLYALEKCSDRLSSKSFTLNLAQTTLKSMKSAEFFRPAGKKVMNSLKIQKIMLKTLVVVPLFASLALDLNLQTWAGTWGDQDQVLEDWEERYLEVSSKVMKGMHWNDDDNLLKYSNKLPGINTPQITCIKDKKLVNQCDLLGACQVFVVLDGQSECFGFDSKGFSDLAVKVKDLLGCKEVSDWCPNLMFLLEQQIEFYYVCLHPGDVMFAQSHLRVLFNGQSTLLTWALIPSTLAKTVCSNYLSCSEGHTFNFPLVAVDYLNRFIGRIDDQVFEALKKIISYSIDDDSWTGNYSLETKDFRLCENCKGPLFWRYVVCLSCSNDSKAFCLKCKTSHSCQDFQFLEKFSPVELDLFLCRIESNKKSQQQKNLIKNQAFDWENPKISAVFDSEERKTAENSLVFLKFEPNSPEVLCHSQSDDSYKRKGKKKMKISENYQNGSCFIDEKSEEVFEDEFEISKRLRKSNTFDKSKKKEMGNGKTA